MMSIKTILLSILFLLLIGCHKIHKDFELLSYYGNVNMEMKGDTLKPIITPKLYAQFDRNGNCNLIRSNIEGKNQFSNLQIKPTLLNEIIEFIRNVKDTIVTIKRNDVIYDGPAIKLIAYDYTGNIKTVRFGLSDRSDQRFVKLYHFIDSASKIVSLKANFDTLKLLNEKEKLVNQTFEEVKRHFPIIIKKDVPKKAKHKD
jgi:hypothetical protein